MQQIKIGISGSAKGSNITKADVIAKARKIGEWIASNRAILVAGGCNGLPNEAAIGAKNAGGFVVGLSPAFSKKEHLETYHSPLEAYNITLYTGKGIKEKSLTNVRSVDALIVIGGGMGTLNEFTVAYDEGKLIGILEGSGGISDHIPEILKMCHREMTSNILFGKDPRQLVERIILGVNEIDTPDVEDERVLSGEGN